MEVDERVNAWIATDVWKRFGTFKSNLRIQSLNTANRQLFGLHCSHSLLLALVVCSIAV